MYCRNCGNDVNEKAIGCPKCGLDPRAEKNFCPNCGTATNEKQVLCTSCGVSLAVGPTTRHTSENAGASDKTVAIVAYIPLILIGFVIALIMHNNNKSKFSAYHLRQSFGLNLLFFATYFLIYFIVFNFIFTNPFTIIRFAWIFPLLIFGILVLFIIGLINANSNQEKPLPIVGDLFEKWFGNMFN